MFDAKSGRKLVSHFLPFHGAKPHSTSSTRMRSAARVTMTGPQRFEKTCVASAQFFLISLCTENEAQIKLCDRH